MDIETINAFQNSYLGGTDQKMFILSSWGIGKKLMLLEGYWSTSFNLIINYL